jgi:hypothetical protein
MTDLRGMRKLASFLALSAVVHLLLLYGATLTLPEAVPEPPPLEARLEPAPPVPPPAPAATPRQYRPRAPAKPVAPAVMTAPQVAAAPTFSVPAPEPEPEPAAQLADATPAPSAPAAPNEVAPAPRPAPAAPAARRLPHKGQISYELFLGTDKFNVGRTLQTWTIENDRYRLTSVSQTTGLASLFARQSIDYVSVGKLTAGGLRPEFFGTERLRSGKTEAVSARFDWKDQTVTFGEPARSAALAADAQDIISFMYQLGLLSMTPGHIELPITNGWKFERYQLVVGGEETLQTPFGAVRAVPVKQVRKPGQESIELWLAPEYRWLPVRIRFYDREGEPSGEQLVNDIRVSDD